MAARSRYNAAAPASGRLPWEAYAPTTSSPLRAFPCRSSFTEVGQNGRSCSKAEGRLETIEDEKQTFCWGAKAAGPP